MRHSPAMHILTPTDFSETSRRAADVAGVLAAKRGATLRLVHSLSAWIGVPEVPVSGVLDEQARQQLTAESERLRAGGVAVDTSLRHGAAGSEVAAVVGESPVDLIVLGSGDPSAGHHLAGSVAEQVAEGVPVPTLVVRRPDPLMAWLRGVAPLRVLCAMDFSRSSDAALKGLKSMAGFGAMHIEADRKSVV